MNPYEDHDGMFGIETRVPREPAQQEAAAAAASVNPGMRMMMPATGASYRPPSVGPATPGPTAEGTASRGGDPVPVITPVYENPTTNRFPTGSSASPPLPPRVRPVPVPVPADVEQFRPPPAPAPATYQPPTYQPPPSIDPFAPPPLRRGPFAPPVIVPVTFTLPAAPPPPPPRFEPPAPTPIPVPTTTVMPTTVKQRIVDSGGRDTGTDSSASAASAEEKAPEPAAGCWWCWLIIPTAIYLSTRGKKNKINGFGRIARTTGRRKRK